MPSTQRPANEVAHHPAASFDRLQREIAHANNAVVIAEGAVEQFELVVSEERGKLYAALNDAQEHLAGLRRKWDERCEAHGVRGVLPAAVVRPANA